MRQHWALLLGVVAAACVTVPAGFNLDRFQSEFPDLGPVRGPDGWYISRLDGPFGTDARSSIWRIPDDSSAPAPVASFSEPGASYSDLTYSAVTGEAYFVKDSDIHAASWSVAEGWRDLGPVTALNSEGYEASPQISAPGALYFASMRDGGRGQGDIYFAKRVNDGWEIETLGPEINSPTGEWNLALSPDGKVMVFESSGRPTNRTVSGDLYLSCMKAGKWQPAIPMHALNTDGSDLDFRFTGPREGVCSSATIGGDAILRYAGPKHFTACK